MNSAPNMEKAIFKQIQGSLPKEPGIYQYFDDKGKLIYVGKAKNIKNRVSSYFLSGQQNAKTTELVQKIKDIRFTIVNSEHDAFILENELIGQSLQIDQIYKCLIRSKAGFRDQKKPLASMLFAGPTGVGKTFCSKLVAENLYSNKNSFIYIDMSEYTDKTSINKLIGSSPGYVGYDKGGILTEKVKKNTHSLILFDEIQKADPDVLFSLLQILEEGKITDTFGSVVDFSNCIIIMTTNIGAQAINNHTIGFNSKSNNIKHDVVSALKNYFPADLLNRIDEIILFNNLNDNHLKNIIKKQLDKLTSELINRKIKLSYTDAVIDFLYSRIELNTFGARQVDKTLQRELHTLIAEKIIGDSKVSQIEISIQNNNICVI